MLSIVYVNHYDERTGTQGSVSRGAGVDDSADAASEADAWVCAGAAY
jgi:hypothetical protein